MSQSQKEKYCMIPFNEVSKRVKLIKAENTTATTRGWGLGEMENCYSKSIKFLL